MLNLIFLYRKQSFRNNKNDWSSVYLVWENNKSRIIALKNGKPDWEQWDYLTPVIPVKHMSAREFQATVKHAMRWFYSIKRRVKAIIKGKVSQGLTILYVWYIAGKMYSGVPDGKRDNLH